jgi:hypothetical protein
MSEEGYSSLYLSPADSKRFAKDLQRAQLVGSGVWHPEFDSGELS